MTTRMATESFSLPVSLLRQHCFCRRIPFFILLRQLDPPRGAWVRQGVDFHKKIEHLLRRRDLGRLGVKKPCKLSEEVSLYSQDLGLHGICDAVLEDADGGVFPVEIKKTNRERLTLGEKIQLAAYAILLEQKYHRRVECGFVLFQERDKHKVVIISPELRQSVLDNLLEIRKDLERGVIPHSDAFDFKCSQCEFFNFCGDRL